APLRLGALALSATPEDPSFAIDTLSPLLVTPFELRSGLMKPWLLPVGAFTRSARSMAYAPAAQLEENAACALLIARSDPIAEASLPDMRARSKPGTAIAAMMPMIATTISSSISVKPFASRIFMDSIPFRKDRRFNWGAS